MNTITKLAAVAAISLAGTVGAEAATVVTEPFFFDTNSFTFTAPNGTVFEEYTFTGTKSFDVTFSGTGLSVDVPALSYSIFETAAPGNVIASGTFTVDAGPLTTLGTTESFVSAVDFTVEFAAYGLGHDFSATYSVVSPSAVVPLPAGVFLLGGALVTLGAARRKKA